MYHLDSNTVIFVLRKKKDSDRAQKIIQKIGALGHSRIAISEIVRAELLTGALKSTSPNKKRKAVERFLEPYPIIPFGSDESEHYARTRANLETRGMKIGPNDLLIAATALAAEATLVTNNSNEFARIPDLSLTDWSA